NLPRTLKSTIYTSPTLTDAYYYRGNVSSPFPPNVEVVGDALVWSHSAIVNVRSWAVYKSTSNTCTLVKVLPRVTTYSTVDSSGDYVVTAVNRLGVEMDSDPVTVLTTVVG
ncbi:UPF0748 protein YngK, partial [Biomphalaria glabrata]